MHQQQQQHRSTQRRLASKQQHSLVLSVSSVPVSSLDPFQLLRIRRDATDGELLASYRRLALLYHPKRLSSSSHNDIILLFTQVAAAYETLIDDKSRTAVCRLLDHNTNHRRRPIVATNSSTSTTLEDTQHYSKEATEMLFGGPMLQLMYQARRFEEFTDPYVLFEQVFGSSLGRSSSVHGGKDATSCTNETNNNNNIAYHHRHYSPHCYQRNTRMEQHEDGTRVSITTRHMGNKCLTRTVRQAPHQAIFVSVTTTTTTGSEQRDDDGDCDTNDKDDPWRVCCV